jgi:hypothetical protein
VSSSLAGRAISPLLLIAATVAVLVAACGLPAVSQRPGVTLYVRNAAPGMAWFAIDPSKGPKPEAVGFGPDPGVACLEAAVGSRVVQSDRSIAEGGTITAVLASVDRPDLVLSVDIGADGNAVIGHDVPAWWTGDPQAC